MFTHNICLSLVLLLFQLQAGTVSLPFMNFLYYFSEVCVCWQWILFASVFLKMSLFMFSFYFLNFILVLNFTILYWFCQILKWIRHRYTCVPHPEPSSLLPPHTIPLGRPSAPAPSIQYHASNLDWRLVSYMILYMFQCLLPNLPTLSLSHRVHKTVLYISVSFAVLYTGLLLPSF